MAAINDLIRDTVKEYPKIDEQDIRTLLIVPEDRLLSELRGAELAAYAQQKLEARKVEVRLKTSIKSAGEDYVELESGERIATQTLLWAGGTMPSPCINDMGLTLGKHGGITVDATCAVPDHPGVWALGDCAEIPEPDGKKTYAPTAQNATREGVTVARNIAAVLRGSKPEPFVYTPLGELALVGKHSGIAEVYGVRFCGLLAWAMWRVVYLAKMPDMRQRVHILMNWILDVVLGRSVARASARKFASRSRANPRQNARVKPNPPPSSIVVECSLALSQTQAKCWQDARP